MRFPFLHPYQISYHVPKTQGRRFVMTDIHGCLPTFEALLNQIHLKPSDQLFLLGDYINRGQFSAGVLNHILQLINSGYQVYPLRGNHEQMALDSHIQRVTGQDTARIYALHRRKGLVSEEGLLLDKYYQFFKALPYFYELDDYFLIHAGFNFQAENPFQELKSMIWQREAQFDASYTQGKCIIFGHTSHSLTQIQDAITQKKDLIPLDNGIYKVSEADKGNLCCLNLDTDELFIQKNIEPPRAPRIT